MKSILPGKHNFGMVHKDFIKLVVCNINQFATMNNTSFREKVKSILMRVILDSVLYYPINSNFTKKMLCHFTKFWLLDKQNFRQIVQNFLTFSLSRIKFFFINTTLFSKFFNGKVSFRNDSDIPSNSFGSDGMIASDLKSPKIL